MKSRTLDIGVLSYQRCQELMETARDPLAGKPIGNNTRIFERGPGIYAVQLHWTDIITFYENGEVQIDTGGWWTMVTKSRIRDLAGISLYTNRKGERVAQSDKARLRTARRLAKALGITLEPGKWHPKWPDNYGTPEHEAAVDQYMAFQSEVNKASEVPFRDRMVFGKLGGVVR